MPRSTSTSFLGNPRLKQVGVHIPVTMKEVQELAKCDGDPIYFIRNYVKIIHVDKGEILFNMWDFQEKMVRLYLEKRFCIIKCPRQVGKALSLDTPINTPSGWRTMRNIQSGDYVYGSDGKPTLVTQAHDVLHNRSCFEVEFDNGEKIIADANHLWTVNNPDWRSAKTLKTSELSELLPKKQANGSGIRIQLASTLDYDSTELPIDPYVLGVWLGDGNSNDGRYTGTFDDVQIINKRIKNAGYEIAEFKQHQTSNAGYQTIYGIRPALRKLAILNNKFIPDCYLRSDKQQRLALLQGLMDTDGSCTKHNGVCEFYQKNVFLLDQVRELISSLGIKSTKSFKFVNGEKYHTVRFSTKLPVFTLTRKSERQKKTQGQRTIINVYIQSIRPVESVPVKCISVAAKDHLYLAGKTMIPTHNSTTTIAFLLHTILFKDNQNIAILANKYQTAQKLLADLKKAYIAIPKWMQQGVVEWNKRNIELENGCKIVASSTAADAIRGNTYNLIFLDEFAHVPAHLADDFFDSVYPTISSGETTKVIMVSTPKGMNKFYNMWVGATNDKDSSDSAVQWNGYTPFAIHWSMVPRPDGKGMRDESWKKETIARTSEEQFRQEFECEFIGSSNTLISPQALNSMATKIPVRRIPMKFSDFDDGVRHPLDVHFDPMPGHQYVLCADVAGGKDQDSCAFVVFDISESPYKVAAKYKSNRISPMLFPDVIADVATKYNMAFVLVETNDNDVAKTLQMDLEYENLITTMTRGKGTQVGGGFTKNVEFGIRTNKSTKRIGCSNLKTLIESQKLITHDYQIFVELTQFVSNTRGSYSAEEGANDDLAMCLVNFGWLVNQKYFKELTDSDVYSQLKKDYNLALEEDVLPFGYISTGHGVVGLQDDAGSDW